MSGDLEEWGEQHGYFLCRCPRCGRTFYDDGDPECPHCGPEEEENDADLEE